MYIVYDIEVFSNFFSIVFYNTEKKRYTDYYFFAGQDWPKKTEALLAGLRDCTLVGFNNLHYDTFFLTEMDRWFKRGASTTQAISAFYGLSNSIINGGFMPRRTDAFNCREEIDVKRLMRIQRSLKWCAFQIGVIENTEYDGDFNKPLPLEDLDKVLAYNRKDVEITTRLLERGADDLAVRYSVRDKYKGGNRILNLDNSGLGAYIVCKKTKMRSVYKDDDLKDININAGDDIIFKWVKKYKWNNPLFKDVFDSICATDLFYPRKFKQKKNFKNSGYYIHDTKDDNKLAINMPFHSSEIKFGVGGLHYARPFCYYDPDRRKEHKEKRVIAIDVTSYYPSLISNNNLRPFGCSENFVDAYSDILEHRKSIPKETVENFTYKIALNSVFGKIRQPGSIFYDQFTFLRVVLNGQILLAQMMDTLQKKGFGILLANTDGIFVQLSEDKYEELDDTIKYISDYSNLSFDKKEIDKIYIRDTNNFTSEGYGDKGYYATSGLTLQHSASNLASKEAARRYLLNNISVEETLRSLWYEGKRDMFCFILANSPKIKAVRFGNANPKSRIYIYYNTETGDTIKIEYESSEKYKHVTCKSTYLRNMEDMKEDPDFHYYECEAIKNIEPFFVKQNLIF